MYINKLADEFIKQTEGLTTEGLVSQEVESGVYEIHLKPYHLPEVDGLNLYSTAELSTHKYKWLTSEEIENMNVLDEYPMNIRTVFKDSEGTHLLTDTYMFLMELPEDKDIEDTIKYDCEEIRGILEGE